MLSSFPNKVLIVDKRTEEKGSGELYFSFLQLILHLSTVYSALTGLMLVLSMCQH